MPIKTDPLVSSQCPGETGEKAKAVQPLVSCRKKRTVAKPIHKAAAWGKLISQCSQQDVEAHRSGGGNFTQGDDSSRYKVWKQIRPCLGVKECIKSHQHMLGKGALEYRCSVENAGEVAYFGIPKSN